MKKLLWGICLLMLTANVFSQKSVRIKVLDAISGKGIPGATVELPNGSSVSTNETGEFIVPPSVKTVHVSSVGYKKFSAEITGEPVQEFRLERFNLFLQPVEIKATRVDEKAPFAKTNLSKKDIEKNNLGQDLPFLLNQTPSVVVNSDAGNGVGYTGIRIRGTDATRINVTLNGIPYNDAESQGTFFVDLPDFASSVGSIQIQRGVGTSSNGSGAFGASINLSTNEFTEQPYGEFNNSYGSFNTWKNTVKAGSGLINNHFTIDARLSRITSDGFIDRASSNLQSFYLSGAYINAKSSLRFNAFSGKEKTYQAWNGILQSDLDVLGRTYNSAGTEKPGEPYDNETDNYQQDNYQLFFNHQFNEYLSLNSAAFLTRGKGYYEQYKAAEDFADYGLPNYTVGNTVIESTDLVRQLWLDNYYYGGLLSLHYKKNNTQLEFGGAGNRYDGNHYGKIIWAGIGIPKDYQWYNLDAMKTDINIYGKWQQKISTQLEAFADLQFRTVKYDINGFRNNPTLVINNNYNFLNPKAGIRYNAKTWTGYISFAVANKEPNRDDFEASPTQQPTYETLHDLELGVEKKSANYSLSANFYYMSYKNQLVLTGKINDVGAYTRTNIPKSYRLGVELQGAVKLTDWLNINANLTLSENKVLDFQEFIDDYDNNNQKSFTYSKANIALSPDIVGGASLNIIPFSNANISLIGKYVSRQYLDNTSNKNRSIADYYVQDLRLDYTLKNKLFKETRFIFQLNNLLDRKYEPNGYTFSYIYGGELSTENYVYPMAGINFMAGINVKL
jgi:iron complex outermembrane receptor protein